MKATFRFYLNLCQNVNIVFQFCEKFELSQAVNVKKKIGLLTTWLSKALIQGTPIAIRLLGNKITIYFWHKTNMQYRNFWNKNKQKNEELENFQRSRKQNKELNTRQYMKCAVVIYIIVLTFRKTCLEFFDSRPNI